MGSDSLPGYPKMKVYREKEDVTLDADTAHPSLALSKDRRSVTATKTKLALANNPGRFDIYLCLLGSDGYELGTHYWDVEVAGTEGWDLGVTRESVSRKGWFNFSPKQGTWAIQLSRASTGKSLQNGACWTCRRALARSECIWTMKEGLCASMMLTPWPPSTPSLPSLQGKSTHSSGSGL
ncbi:unnamed protein product [Eretmochelys imbricata]